MTVPDEPRDNAPDPINPDATPTDDGWVQLPEPEMPPGYDQPTPVEDSDLDDEPGNVDDAGQNHFAVVTANEADTDVCGGCGQSWPCDAAYDLGLAVRPEAEEDVTEE